ncbi:MAG: DUF2254 domain-containing protein [Ginsengibacter sp.]
MNNRIIKWLRENTNKMIHSIAFYPAIIAIGFLILSALMLQFDFSESGKHIKASLSWLTLKDASTARSIVSTIAAGIISLTVFSFSMVMIVLNQAASQMSNRMLESMIGNRFQQFVLGVYIGSIVYALFLLTNIRDINSGIYVPALSIYLLLLITVLDIFIFIYFLHYVTQSVKFETIIERVHKQTIDSLHRICTTQLPTEMVLPETSFQKICLPASGYFQGFNKNKLTKLVSEHDGVAHFLYATGTFLLKGTPVLNFYCGKKLSESEIEDIVIAIDFYNGQPIDLNPYYGFHQLAEVAIKALSPGINDPETAVLSVHALTDLFAHKLHHFSQSIFEDEKGIARVQSVERDFGDLFEECYYPIWEYGKKDLYIQNAMRQMIVQLMKCDTEGNHSTLFTVFLDAVNKQIGENEFHSE